MSNETLDQPGKVADLVAKSSLDPEALPLIQPTMTARQAVAALVTGGRFTDAIRLAARALPRREAVWWACQCFRASPAESDTPAQVTAVDLAEKWVVKPTEEGRRAAGDAAELAQIGTAAGQIAMAAFWSGGSLAPPKMATVPPAEHLLSVAVGNAAILAGVRLGPKLAEATYQRFVALAIDVAEGKNRWKEERAPTPTPVRPVPPRR